MVAVGGDGTVNEVVNGLAGNDPPVTLGIINTGRGKDCCRNLGLPCRVVLQAERLLEGREAPIDIGLACWPDGRRRHFVNALGAGFDAAVAERAQRGGGSGTLPYLLAVLHVLRRYRPVPAAVLLDGAPLALRPVAAVVAANGPHYGGGMKIAPAADPRDGLLDLVLLGDLGRAELLCWLPLVYRGWHLANSKVITAHGKTVAIEVNASAGAGCAPLPIHVDGEPCGETPVQVSILPGALRLRA